MRRIRQTSLVVIGAVVVALVAAACGSSSTTTSSSSSSSSSASIAGPTTGPGLTEPTAPSGARISGGTAYFTEAPDAPPTYIFPLYDFAECTTTNIDEFENMMYPPLYQYGDNYSPTVDYSNSIANQPTFSNGGKTVTMTLKNWKWSDGESVTSRDLVFWMNLMKASPATEWCGYVPGYFPDNVVSYSAPNPSTFVLNFKQAYNPDWVINNELSQLTPMPLAWDRTSTAGCGAQCKAPTNTSNLPDTTKAGAASVYKFLDGLGKKPGSWVGSPIWSTVDGPFKLAAFTTAGEATLVPNPDYSGTPKPSISKFVELPFTSEAATYNAMRSGGPNAVTIGSVPSEYAPQLNTLASEGYMVSKAASYSFSYFPLNFNTNTPTSPGGEPLRYIIRQPYFREALQHLVDQPGWIHAFFLNTAVPTCGPIPFAPPSPLVSSSAVSQTPCTFSPSAAKGLLVANGWNVVPNGTTTCVKPGTAVGDCGTGINKGEGITLPIDYQSGVVSTEDSMNDLAAQAKKLGITISLTTHPFQTVVAEAVPCAASSSTCKWVGANWGAGWIYGPDYLPTGEDLYFPGAAANAGNYVDPSGKMSKLIEETITAPESQEAADLATYANYVGEQVPVVFQPTEVGTFGGVAAVVVNSKLGGYTANALGFLNPQDWYFTK
jgi:peptide/nickel transport system substrate-binding protein